MSRIWKTCLFLVFLGGAEGAKIFWGLPNRFSTNPERIVKVRESAPSKIGLLCIGDVHWWCALDDVVVDDRLMITCNIYNFPIFFKKTFLTMLRNILLWISNKKTRSCFEQSSGIRFCSWMIAWWLLDDRLSIPCNIYNFQFFSKEFFWQCRETYYCEYQIKNQKLFWAKFGNLLL